MATGEALNAFNLPFFLQLIHHRYENLMRNHEKRLVRLIWVEKVMLIGFENLAAFDAYTCLTVHGQWSAHHTAVANFRFKYLNVNF